MERRRLADKCQRIANEHSPKRCSTSKRQPETRFNVSQAPNPISGCPISPAHSSHPTPCPTSSSASPPCKPSSPKRSSAKPPNLPTC
ncbi:hypothetical protein [Kingella oralis]